MKIRTVNLPAATLQILNELAANGRLGYGCDGYPELAQPIGSFAPEERKAIDELFKLKGPYHILGLQLPDFELFI